MLLPDKIKQLRNQAKIPQRKVAAALDIDPATYSKIENGKYVPSRDFVLQLSYFFEYDSEQFLKLWLADRLVEIAKDENMGKEAMHLATDLINYDEKE